MDEHILSEHDLRSRLGNFEDPFVERKVEGDLRDCLKTAVAFANTLPVGIPGVLFIPAKNDGTIKTGVDLDKLQRSISERLAEAYPPLLYFQRLVMVEDRQVIAVLVPGSPQRPHFAGPAFIRDGSKTVNASALQFEALVARRSSMTEEILKWHRQKVTLFHLRPNYMGGDRVQKFSDAQVEACNLWWVTLIYQEGVNHVVQSFSLHRIHLTYDDVRKRLGIELET